MVSPQPTFNPPAEPAFESPPGTPKQTHHNLRAMQSKDDRAADSTPVYAYPSPTTSDKESGLLAHPGGDVVFMSGNGRSGSDQARPGSSRRRNSSQTVQQRHPPPYQDPTPQPPPQAAYHPMYPAQYQHQHQPPRSGYPGQYMMSPQPHAHAPSPTFAYPPAFHVPEQPQSIHAGYPTLASYPQYQPENQYPSPQSQGTSPFRFPSPMPMSPSYSPYQHQQSSFSPQPALYAHTHPQSMYPGGAYAYPQHHSPGGAQDGDGHGGGGGTWWYVPSQPAQHTMPQQYEGAGPSHYAFYPHPAAQQQPQQQHMGDGDAAYLTADGDAGYVPSSPSASLTHGGGGGGASAKSSSSGQPPPSPVPTPSRDKPIVRRTYHPNPPAHRSEWVMWAGNVPSDAGHDELWRFFTQPPEDSGGGGSTTGGTAGGTSDAAGGSGTGRCGVLSIFLISRSNCAFVNYETEADLQTAIARFNGVPLRAQDPRCPRLVCRMRRKDDDLRAGVGGQRGMGMHARWVKAKEKEQGKTDEASSTSSVSESDPGTPSSSSDAAHSLEVYTSALSLGSSDEEHTRPPARPHGGSSSGSHASTDSSLLRQHFPQRFFILKSLTRDDLDLSLQTGLWATQKHNEGVLDRAFRTSKDVFLIFSVNKSGEFYGYARMAGPIVQSGDRRVSWSRRDSSSAGSPVASRPSGAGASHSQTLPALGASAMQPTPPQVLGSSHFVDNSPQPLSNASNNAPTTPQASNAQSAPAVLGHPAPPGFSPSEPVVKYSLDHHVKHAQKGGDITLDPTAPYRKMRQNAAGDGPPVSPISPAHPSSASGSSALGSVPEEVVFGETVVPASEKEELAEVVEPGAAREEGWGQEFKLKWICTERLPFQRTRHIRNPWNHDREIKVSRDGTEIEPGVGQALLEEWRAYLAEGMPANEAGSASASASASTRSTGSSQRPGAAPISRAGGSGGGGGTSRS